MSLNKTKYKVKSNFSNTGITYLEKKTLTPNEKRLAGEKTLFTREREREDIYFTDNYWDEVRKNMEDKNKERFYENNESIRDFCHKREILDKERRSIGSVRFVVKH